MRREKDIEFSREAVNSGLTNKARLLGLVTLTAVADYVKERIRAYIEFAFRLANDGPQSAYGFAHPILPCSVLYPVDRHLAGFPVIKCLKRRSST